MRLLVKINEDLSKVNYRIANLKAQLVNCTISQKRLIDQRLETLTTIKGALEEEINLTTKHTIDRMASNIAAIVISWPKQH